MAFNIDIPPLTRRMYAGIRTNNKGWTPKTDRTQKACFIAALHIREKFKGFVVTADGEKCYEITVKEVRNENQN